MDARVAKCALFATVLSADGVITEDERTLLEEVMSRASLTQAERDVVTNLDSYDEAIAAAAALPETERRTLLGDLVEAASVDGRLSALEAKMLKDISAALF
jgi:uncharacterized tellurite resistance protein B-like protein